MRLLGFVFVPLLAGASACSSAAGTAASDASTPPSPSVTCTTVAGACLYTLASGQDHPSSLALDEGTLYWTNERAGTVLKVATTGGTPVTVATKDEQGISVSGQSRSLPTRVGPLAVSSSSVYWWAVSDTATEAHSCPMTGPCSDLPGVWWPVSAPLSGGAPASLGLTIGSGPAPSPMSGVAANADGVFFASPGLWVIGESTGELGSGNPFRLVTDTHTVFWTDPTAGTITSASTAGDGVGKGTVLATRQAKPTGIAFDGESLYWTNAGDGTVVKMPKSGGVPLTVATGQTAPFGIGVSSSGTYWTDQAGTVMKVANGGGPAVTLASDQPTPYALVVDSGSVYFTTYVSNGSVMKLTERCSCP